VILVAGIPTEPPVDGVIEALGDLGADFVVLNQRRFGEIDLAWAIDDAGAVDGVLDLGGTEWYLRDVTAVYTRLMDDRRLPELTGEPEGSPRRARCRELHDGLITWIDIGPPCVVNRSGAMCSNASKPFQAQCVTARGFRTPETLITNDPVVATQFVADHDGEVVYKSASGVRSIVQKVDDAALARLDAVRFCPVQFQAYVRGVDTRVHVVGDEVLATEITSDAVDYRYAAQQVDAPPTMRAVELDTDVAQRCVALARDLGLAVAGIDLSITPDGEVYCFEVNPSPGYSYFEANTGQPIARTIAQLLMSGRPA
jgi:hypothetical protein